MKVEPKMLPLEPKHLLNWLVILDFRYQNIYMFVSGGFLRIGIKTVLPVPQPIYSSGLSRRSLAPSTLRHVPDSGGLAPFPKRNSASGKHCDGLDLRRVCRVREGIKRHSMD